MKHAYLIIAHSQFDLLQRLASVLDDKRNDIFVHVDKKVAKLPELHVNQSQLFILDNRVDVRWGDLSVVEAEYALFEKAIRTGAYSYFHLLSGVDMPLKNQDKIHAFFDAHVGKEFIGYSQYDYGEEVDRKVKRYHLFPKHYRNSGKFLDFIRKGMRFGYLQLQYLFRQRRHRQMAFKKGTQWVSLTGNFVAYLLTKKKEVLTTYHHSFCSDEIYKQTLCWHSPFRAEIYDINNEARGCMRMIGWENGALKDWKDEDYDKLMQSDFLFARKFNNKHLQVVDRITKKLQSGSKK